MYINIAIIVTSGVGRVPISLETQCTYIIHTCMYMAVHCIYMSGDSGRVESDKCEDVSRVMKGETGEKHDIATHARIFSGRSYSYSKCELCVCIFVCSRRMVRFIRQCTSEQVRVLMEGEVWR